MRNQLSPSSCLVLVDFCRTSSIIFKLTAIIMASPVSIGDVLELAKGIVRLYKLCRDAGKEMREAVDKAAYAASILEAIQSHNYLPSFLRSPKGQNLSVIGVTKSSRRC